MSLFPRLNTSKSIKNQQIGLSEDDSRYCLVHLQAETPTILWQEKPYSAELLCQQAAGNLKNFTIIRPIPHHYIWRKSLFLAKQANQDIIYRQIIQVLKQELPITLEEIYFDYLLEPIAESDSVRIVIYALRKNFAQPLMLNTATILDCELHCAQRALHFLYPESTENQYHFRGKTVQFKAHEPIFSDASQGLGKNDDPLYLTALGAALWS